MDLINGNQISSWIAQGGIWPLVVMLVPNLMFRRYGQAALKKRMASLIQAIAVFVVTSAAAFIAERDLKDLYLWIAVIVVITALVAFRDKVFPYSLKCVECGKSLEFRTIYFMDDNACPACHDRLTAEKAAENTDEELESAGVTDASEEAAAAGAGEDEEQTGAAAEKENESDG